MVSLLRRLSIYGDIWLHYLFFGTRVTPWFLEPVLVWSFALLFFLLCGPQRRAVIANLGVIRPDRSRYQILADAFRVVRHFAWTLNDFAHVQLGHEVINWEIAGRRHIEALASEPGGALILTAHMGNYEVAAPLLASHLKRPVHTVRAPEREAASQDFMARHRDSAHSDLFKAHYNEPGNMLGVELAKILQSGEIVAIQGDRILFDVSPQEAEFHDGIRWRLPRGPFALARIARVPMIPLFIIHLGWRHYRIQAHEPFVWQGDPSDRASAQAAALNWWTQCLRSVVEEHWYQWFVFEPAFSGPDEGDFTAAAEST